MDGLVCGVDEAGRGPLAGPVTAAAVILPRSFPNDILDDSKKLTARQREEAEAVILKRAIAVGVGWVWPKEIDRVNIHVATLLAMRRALLDLDAVPDLVYVDGRFSPCTVFRCEAVVKGDTFVPEIQAASIIAKTARDRYMTRYARIDPRYCFDRHKGYGSRLHRELIGKFGPCGIHRMSFRMEL